MEWVRRGYGEAGSVRPGDRRRGRRAEIDRDPAVLHRHGDRSVGRHEPEQVGPDGIGDGAFLDLVGRDLRLTAAGTVMVVDSSSMSGAGPGSIAAGSGPPGVDGT